MREGQATVIRREDYTAPAYWIETVDLTFDLDPAKTRVLNRMRVRRNPEVAEQALSKTLSAIRPFKLRFADLQAAASRAEAQG